MSHFSERLLPWFDQHGRKDLPWQQAISPYRVWISEIMLQQTQVTTVIPYYENFMQRFPDLPSLAKADEAEVLQYWAGLGYYARARNLHKTAQKIMQDHQAEFPADQQGLEQLPGIGRSTAGAILSIAFQQVASILDGNVKRVLARHYAISGWPGKAAVQKQLWQIAEEQTPTQRVADYSQAIMDLGATLCTRSTPQCSQCPLGNTCQARQQDRQADFPESKPKKVLAEKEKILLILRNEADEIFMEKRPPVGIWGGLWSLPECDLDEDLENYCRQRFGWQIEQPQALEKIRHTFTHFHLHIHPVQAKIAAIGTPIMEADQTLWYKLRKPNNIGMAAPISRLLTRLQEQ